MWNIIAFFLIMSSIFRSHYAREEGKQEADILLESIEDILGLFEDVL